MPEYVTQRLPRQRPVVALAVGLVLLMAGAEMLSDRYGGWVFSRTDFFSGAWWQLGSAQWVHFGGLHAAPNAASLVLMLWAMQGLVAGALQGAALAGGYIGVAVVLVLDPACSYYAGASGALHGLWAGNAVSLLWGLGAPLPRSHGLRWLGGAMLLALLVKFGWQTHDAGALHTWQALVPLPLDLADFPVYTPSHTGGAAGGVVAVLLYALWFRLAARTPACCPAGRYQ